MIRLLNCLQIGQALHGAPENGRSGDGHFAVGESIQRDQDVQCSLAANPVINQNQYQNQSHKKQT